MKKLLPLSLFFVGLQPNSAALIRQARTTFSPIISRAHYNFDLKKSAYSGQALLSNKRYYQNNSTKSYKFFLLSAITFTLVDSNKKDQKPSFYRHMPEWVGRLTAKIKGDEVSYFLSQQTDEELNSIVKSIINKNTPRFGGFMSAILYADYMSALGDELYKRGMYKEAEEAYENCEKASYPDYRKEKKLRFKIGDTAFMLGNYRKATAAYLSYVHELSEPSYQSNEDTEKESALAYEKCGHAFLASGAYEEAEKYYGKAMALYKELHDENIDWFRVLQDVWIMDASKGNFNAARSLSQGCLEMMEKKNITPTQNMLDNHQMLVELAKKGKDADVQFCL